MRRGLLGKGSLPDHFLATGPDFARAARKNGDADVPGRRTSASAAERAGFTARPKVPCTAASSRPCASRWRCTARSSRARAATRSWTRSDSRSKISTLSGSGAPPTTEAAINPAGTLVDGTKLDGVVGLREALLQVLAAICPRDHREADDLRPGPRHRILRHAAGPLHRARRGARTTTSFSSLVLGVVKSEPFQMNQKMISEGSQEIQAAGLQVGVRREAGT